jgi:hypothetical protein
MGTSPPLQFFVDTFGYGFWNAVMEFCALVSGGVAELHDIGAILEGIADQVVFAVPSGCKFVESVMPFPDEIREKRYR